MLYLNILSHKREEESLGRLAGTCSPVLVWNMQSSMEGENSLIRHELALHFEWRKVDGPIKPQDACCNGKWGRRKDCLPADLPPSGGRKRTRKTWIDEGRSLPTKQGFQQRTKKRAGVAFHSRFQKKEKRKFHKRKTKNKTINYQSSWRGIPWTEAPYQNQHFSSILTLAILL